MQQVECRWSRGDCCRQEQKLGLVQNGLYPATATLKFPGVGFSGAGSCRLIDPYLHLPLLLLFGLAHARNATKAWLAPVGTRLLARLFSGGDRWSSPELAASSVPHCPISSQWLKSTVRLLAAWLAVQFTPSVYLLQCRSPQPVTSPEVGSSRADQKLDNRIRDTA